jgi:ribonuclease P protein component
MVGDLPVPEPSATGSNRSESPGADAKRGRISPPRGSAALPKEKRLAKRREFLRVYESGRKIFSRYTVVFFAANDLPHSRLGITATKKSGKANVRNRLKRRTREVYRRQREAIGIDVKSIDVVVNVKPNAAQASFLDYSQDLTRVLRRVVSECSR